MDEASGDDDAGPKLLDTSEDHTVDRPERQLVQDYGQEDGNGTGGEHGKQRANTEGNIVVSRLRRALFCSDSTATGATFGLAGRNTVSGKSAHATSSIR